MLDREGGHHTFDSTLLELVPDERIVMTFRFAPGAEDTLLTLTFRDAEAGGTQVAPAARADHAHPTPGHAVGRHRLEPERWPSWPRTSTRSNPMTEHSTSTRQEWEDARRSLLEREKQLTRLSDELATERAALPWVPVETAYTFDTEDGDEVARRPLRRQLAAARLPLHVRPRLGRGLPELLLADGPRRDPAGPSRAPRRQLRRRLARTAGEAARVPLADGVDVPVGVVVRARLQLRLQGLLDRRAAAAGVQLHAGARSGGPASCRG